MISISEEEVAGAIRSLPNSGSVGSNDGLTALLISPSARGSGQALLSALTSFVKVVLDGKHLIPV